MEHDDVHAARPEELQAANDGDGVVEQVRDEHDHPALVQRIGQLLERLGDVRPGAGFETLERQQDRGAGGSAVIAAESAADTLVERDEPDGVPLSADEPGERSGQARAVLELGQRSRSCTPSTRSYR